MEKLVDFVKSEPSIADSEAHMQIAVRFDVALAGLTNNPVDSNSSVKAICTHQWRKGMVEGVLYAMDALMLPDFDPKWVLVITRAREIYAAV